MAPTGTMTFLFTDIEGSTRLWASHPVTMQAALARHDGLLREAIERYGGSIVKNTGDGVLAAFLSAPDAVAACLAAQRALQASAAGTANAGAAAPDTGVRIALKVRMGLHTGPAELRDGDYFGASLSRAARIMAAAHGGQILLSAATADSARGHLPDGVTLRELGEHRLKGLFEPERLLQVIAPDLPTDFPPLASLTPHRLPAERDVFVGRRDALAELARRLAAGARLISIVGLGGTGKTRLVVRLGWNSLGDFPGGAWFCDLSEARSVDGVVNAVAVGLDVPLGKGDPVAQLGHAIAGHGKCLVILDNFEQVARHAEETLGRWLDRAPNARFLVTTREVLGLPGEEVFALPPMEPTEAATLFMRRAEAAQPGFAPGPEDQAAIEPLVKVLEGMPLAIELAAARVRVIPPRTLVARMNERFKLLASTGGRLDRQATLRAVFDWSWDLLSVPEKAALAQLSVFEGGFTVESVEAVLDLSAYKDAPWAIDALQSLVQKSLVRVVADDRFELLTSVREYADEQLRLPGRFAGSGPHAMRAAEERHGAWYAALDEDRVREQRGADLDNVVAACRRAIARGDGAVAVGALARAHAVRWMQGPYSAALELAESVLAMPSLEVAQRAPAARIRGAALSALGRTDQSRDVLEESVLLARVAGDPCCEARALVNLADIERSAARFDAARDHLESALRLGAASGDLRTQSECRNALGSLAMDTGEPRAAHAHYAAALDLAQRLGDRRWEGGILGNVAGVHLEQGRLDEAEHCYVAAIAVAREHTHRAWEGNMVCNLGFLRLLRDDAVQARASLQTALQIAREIGHARLECVALANLALAEERLGEPDEARSRLETAIELAARIDERRFEGQFHGYLGALHARAARIEEAFASLDAGERLLRALDDGISLGVLLCARAEALAYAGEATRAHAMLAEARALAVQAHAGESSELGQAIDRTGRILDDAPMTGS